MIALVTINGRTFLVSMPRTADKRVRIPIMTLLAMAGLTVNDRIAIG